MRSARKFSGISDPRWSACHAGAMRRRRLPPLRFLAAAAALLVLGFAGCDSTDDEGPGSAQVYGDFGYSAPWYYPSSWYGEGGSYGHPPYDRGYRPAEHGGQGSGPGRAAPGGGGRGIPSIPNQSRPSMGGGGGAPRGGGGGGGAEHRH